LDAAARFVVYGFFTAAGGLLMRPRNLFARWHSAADILPGPVFRCAFAPTSGERNSLFENVFERLGVAVDALAVSRRAVGVGPALGVEALAEFAKVIFM
jgi:hypothetical protein